MSKNNETKQPAAAPLPSLTDQDLEQVLGGIGRPSVYTALRGRRRVK